MGRAKVKKKRKKKPKINLSDVEEAARRRGKEDLFFLTKEILGYRELVPFHQGVARHMLSGPRVLTLMPRGTFKTTIGTIGLSIFTLINNPEARILINNDILENGKSFLREIKGQFETNADLRILYGDFVGSVWQSDKIIIKQRKGSPKEPSVCIGAIGHEKTSGHFDLIINDDLAGLKDMLSEAKRKATAFYYDTQEDLIEPWGRIVTHGTRWHLFDIYHRIMSQFKDYRVNEKWQKAILDNGQPLFPQRFSIEALREKQRKNPIMFSAQNLNNPLPLEGQLYNVDELRTFNVSELDKSKLYVISYTDPALGKNKKSDFVCIITIGVAEDGKIYVLDCYLEKEKSDRVCNIAKARRSEWRWDRAGGESNGFQDLYLDKFEAAIGMKVERIDNRGSKDTRIRGMRATVLDDVYFRSDWMRAYPQLIEQLTLYPQAQKDDGPDGLAGVLGMAQGGSADTSDDFAVDVPEDHYRTSRRSVLK